jgi:hypothetical protein
MPKLPIKFNSGTQYPVKLGTPVIKPTNEGFVSYAQNINLRNDKYGHFMALPGPALTDISGMGSLTGVPWLRALFTFSTANVGWLYFMEGLLGSKVTGRRVQDIEAGETPSIGADTGIINHVGHGNAQVTDMIYKVTSSASYIIYVAGKDDSDGWVFEHGANATGINWNIRTTLAAFNTGREPKLWVANNGKTYIGHGNRLDSLSPDGITYALVDLDIPEEYGITSFGEWNDFLAIFYSTDYAFTFGQRKSGGRSGVLLWDKASPSFTRDIPCSSRYISARVSDPDGSMDVFSGLDEGRTTIWQFNGYGFSFLTSYIGDMPRSRHSVEFDGLGRLCWQTADGQICRLDKRDGTFEHPATIPTSDSAGGLFAKAVGGVGNEFIAASGSGSNYYMKLVQFDKFIGNGDADGVTTPRFITGQQLFPSRSTFNKLEVVLNKELETGEKIEFYIHKNGRLTGTLLGSLDYANTNDRSKSSKVLTTAVKDVDNFAIEPVWRNANGALTAPGLVSMIADYTPNSI